MKRNLATILLLAGGLVLGGCATKKYVAQTVDPVKAKVDQVADQTNKQGATLEETRKELEKDETQLSATTEKASSADSRASDALSRADAANRAASELRQTIANLDDYKVAGQGTVNFKFNSDKLTDEGKQQLDQLVAQNGTLKRYFIAVEGFTDRIGSDDYNIDLSRRRADRVVHYLVMQHNVPLYRIHLVGLGKAKPVDEGRTRDARAKNRRVEVTIFSADSALANIQQGQSAKPQQ
ncbi:MAG TPA: OmpA family protein [Candidatus Acidoferrales bacterium]|nr:OmpA family protein [Candidatus Acidoferrales bacterium]